VNRLRAERSLCGCFPAGAILRSAALRVRAAANPIDSRLRIPPLYSSSRESGPTRPNHRRRGEFPRISHNYEGNLCKGEILFNSRT
jgi:hypothetical protein